MPRARRSTRIRVGLLLACLLAVAGAPTPLWAAEPSLQGIWLFHDTGPGIGPPTYYASIHESGATVVAILLSPEGDWIHAIGTRSGSTAQGTIYTPSGAVYGSARITITSPTTLTGSSTGQGITTPLIGTKLF